MGKEYGSLVSIIVPVYNAELYLTECLDSLVGQTYRNIEILLIDDGSTDASGDICNKYAESDERVKVFHKANEGVSSTRNAGIDLAQGEYLIFVDSDDFVHQELIEIYMLNEKNHKSLLCEYILDSIMWKETYLDEWEENLENVDFTDFMRLYYRDYMNSPWNKLYCTRIIKEQKIVFPSDKNLGEDLLFNLEYYRYVRKPYCVIHCPLYCHRQNVANSLSNSYRTDLFEIQQELFLNIKKFLEDMEIWSNESAKIYYSMYWDRLFLTVRICYAYEKNHPEEQQLTGILNEPIWDQVWEECKKRKVSNIKRRLKLATLKMIRFLQ